MTETATGDYRFLHNMRVPADTVECNFLLTLADYRIGQPIPGTAAEAMQLQDLLLAGIVGIYTTEAAISDSRVKRLIGWYQPAKLGAPWEPLGVQK